MAEPRRLTELAERPRAIMRGADAGRFVVALSGGADSACAAWLAAESTHPARAVHVHHGSIHSDVLERAAVRIATRLDLGIDVVRVHVPAGASYEAQARSVRRAALAEAAGPGAWIVTGHTRDDQIETVLMRLGRGTGLDGMAGMARSETPYLRPLLDTSRSAVREMATIVGLDWRDDPANFDRRHLRNRVRREVLPVLESVLGPAVGTSLNRSADVIRRDIEALEALASRVERHDGDGRVELALADLERLGEAIAARAIRNAIRTLDPPYPPPARVVATALDIAAGRTRRAEIGRLRIEIRGIWLTISLEQ